MKKTQEKILVNAIKLFNKKGVSNVRLQDIAKKAGISAGNLSYHYKIKKDLMEAVLKYMTNELAVTRGTNLAFLEKNDYVNVIKNYLGFQIRHRFFYRDILEIINLVPSADLLFENQIKQVVNFSKNGLYLAIGRGIIIPEPFDNHYHVFSKNMWAIMQGWLTEREVLKEEKISLHQVINAILEAHYPYFTEKGKLVFEDFKNRLSELVAAESAEKYQAN